MFKYDSTQKMIKAGFQPYILNFLKPGGTSRGVLKTKATWFLKVAEGSNIGIGECNMFQGLSIDDRSDYEEKLKWTCENINLNLQELLDQLIEFPSIQFGVEQALLSLKSVSPFDLFPSKFTNGQDHIPINGLIWMGSKDFMKQQIREKLDEGFRCIKMKIGAIDFETEIDLLRSIRKEYSAKDIELRVDANGAFAPELALENLNRLSELDLHSIEQPIKQGQFEDMARLCEVTPLPIALDEELIGVFSVTNKRDLLQMIHPQYIILKPSLVGGYKGSSEWITLAEQQNIGWWVTSALESNIGLNAIAQWTYTLNNNMPQGLGTGSLFTNNFDAPLQVEEGTLRYKAYKEWNLTLLDN